MKVAIVIAVIVLILAFVLGSAYVTRRNQMAIKREAVNAQWAQVDVVLQRRADLIPNLVRTENRIAVERKRYNDAVQDYNTYISLFPNSLVASFGGFTRNDAYFKTEEGARQAPKVNFDYSKPAPAPSATPAPAHP